MAYTSPHSVREYLVAASLRVVHQSILHCQARSKDWKKDYLSNLREIDICAQLADYFGSSARLAAQGNSDIDLVVKGPTLRAEVKYFRPPAVAWTSASVKKDWDWLLNCSTAGDEFRKRAWLVFWPCASAGMFKLTNCLSVSRSHGTQFSLEDFAPFATYATPEMPANGQNQRLRFHNYPRESYVSLHGGKTVRVDLVGSHTHPLWCAIYTRVKSTDVPAGATRTAINNTPIVVP